MVNTHLDEESGFGEFLFDEFVHGVLYTIILWCQCLTLRYVECMMVVCKNWQTMDTAPKHSDSKSGRRVPIIVTRFPLHWGRALQYRSLGTIE